MQPASPTPVAAHVRASKAEVTGGVEHTRPVLGQHLVSVRRTLSGRRGGSGGNNLRGAELLLGRVLRDGVLRLLREEDCIVARLLGMGGGDLV